MKSLSQESRDSILVVDPAPQGHGLGGSRAIALRGLTLSTRYNRAVTTIAR